MNKATTQQNTSIPITHFRDQMRKHLKTCVEKGQITISQGKYLPYETFTIIHTGRAGKKAGHILWY